jgi:tetratricopeptide (TPR) repeat protein
MDQLTEAGKFLLERLSFFASEPVPVSLLDTPIHGSATPQGLDPLVDLARYSLVTRDPAAETFTVHRIVSDVSNRRLNTDSIAYTTRLTEALDWMDAAFTGDAQDVRTWPTLNPLAPHAEAVAEYADTAGIVEPTVDVISRLARLFRAQALHRRAEPHYRRALAIAEAYFPPTDPRIATHLNNLAVLLQNTDQLGEAEPLMRRALAIDEAHYGQDHPSVAIRLNNLAQLLQATNCLGEAEPMMRRALAIDEAHYGQDHPSVAIRLNNLAGLLRITNRLGEAEPLMRRALAIDEVGYGQDHPNVATSLNNLAGLLRATNRLGEAEPLYRRALAIDKASYGQDHPDVAIDLNNLAALLQATNRLGEAEPLMRRHLVIFLMFQRDTGHAHPHRDAAIRNYSGLLSKMGHDEASIRTAIEDAVREAGLG